MATRKRKFKANKKSSRSRLNTNRPNSKKRATTRPKKHVKSDTPIKKTVTKKKKRITKTLDAKAGSKKSKKKFANPLAIPLPPSYIPYKRSKEILMYKKLQHKLWGWAVALAILLMISVTVIELASDFGLIVHISHNHHELLINAELLSILVIGLELYSQFKAAKNKILFLKQNWLVILAILPIGLIFRAGRIFEGVKIVESIGSIRAFQVAAKADELRAILPVLEIPDELLLSIPSTEKIFERGRLFFRTSFSSFGGFSEFVSLVSRLLIGLFKVKK